MIIKFSLLINHSDLMFQIKGVLDNRNICMFLPFSSVRKKKPVLNMHVDYKMHPYFRNIKYKNIYFEKL